MNIEKKEFLVDDKAVQEVALFKGWDDQSFGEKARELGGGETGSELLTGINLKILMNIV